MGDRERRSGGGGGERGPADGGGAPGVRGRTDRLSSPRKRNDDPGAGLDGARRSIKQLGALADQLASAIAGRNFLRARALAASIESLRRSMVPTLASAARSGADPDAIAELEAAAAPLAARLDALIPLAPEPGLGGDLDPATDAAREAAWLASLPSAPGTQPIRGAVDPASVSAQPGDATGTVDAPLIEWDDVKHAALSGPFTAAPRDVQNVLTGPLVDLLRERKTIHLLLDPTGRDPIKNSVADVIADLANDPAFTMGFAEGALTGTVRAVYDTLKGFHDAGKLIQEILVKLATFQHRDLLAQGTKAIDDLMKVIENSPGLLEEFLARWRASDSYTRGAFQGEVLGYVVTQIAIIIAGSLAGPEIIAAGPFAKLIQALGWLDNPIAGITHLARGAKLSTTTLEALRAGRGGIRSIEPLAEARSASRAFDDLDGAAVSRPLASADARRAEVPVGAASGQGAETVTVSGVAQGPRLQWRKNPDGAVRTIDDAVEIARHNGVEIPDDLLFRKAKGRYLKDNTLAQYFSRRGADPNARVTWTDFYDSDLDEILVRVDASVFESDEAIVAVQGGSDPERGVSMG